MSAESKRIITVAAISDTHLNSQLDRNPKKGQLTPTGFRRAVAGMSERADIIIHCGDFTDKGDEKSLYEAASILKKATKPVIGVLGNHDISYNHETATDILRDTGKITLLEGNSITVDINHNPIGIIGLPGFKMFEGKRPREVLMETYQAMCEEQESRFLEELPKLESPNNIVIFHFDQMRYVPSDTDPNAEELYTSNLLEAVDDYPNRVNLIIHGHDHRVIARPLFTPNNISVIDVASRIQIEMHPGVPYSLIKLALN